MIKSNLIGRPTVAFYYTNIRKLGLKYEYLDYVKSLDFLLMTVNGIEEQHEI